MPTITLLEPSFLGLITAIEPAADLSAQCRRHWACSVRQIAKWLDRPTATIPARWNAVRVSVSQLHHARLRVTAKTLANHKSNVCAALRWFGREHDVPQRGARLSAAWASFGAQLDDRIAGRLYALMRYCSARRIGPSLVDDRNFDEYWRYRTETTGRATNNSARRFMVRAWNGAAAGMNGLPLQRLTEPPLKVMAQPAWDSFPAGLRQDVDDYFAALARVHRTLEGKRISHAALERSGPAGQNLSP